MAERVMGLDPSLTATGVALPDGRVMVLQPPKCCNRGMRRLAWLRNKVLALIVGYEVGLVFIEGYSYGSRHSHAHSLGELGGVLRLAIHETNGVEYIDVPPSSLKKFATGKGNAKKELVLVEAVKRLGYQGSNDNEADALWLRALGHQVVGDPIVDLPKHHLDGLDKVGADTE